jgi:hypothetical protein
MHKITTATAALALGVITAAAVSGASAQATTHQAAAPTDGSRSHQHLQVLRFIDKVDSNSNTDIDLGVPGPSAGDQQVFRDGLFQNGRRIGTSNGVGEVVTLTATTLTAQVVSTAILPGGNLTSQLAFTEILADGPPKVLHSAITGGTGTYRNARGECQAEFINNTDDTKVTCTIILGE